MTATKSLKAQQKALGKAANQVEILSDSVNHNHGIPTFGQKLAENSVEFIKPLGIDTMQINLGKMCNQVCQHCHVDAGPDRREIMNRETMQECLNALKMHPFNTVDLTGGAPELNPDFRWFVEEIRKISPEINIIVRCNLTIILANKRFNDLPEFFKQHRIELVSSLPAISENRTDAQRGKGVFQDSIKALQMLNQAGYGMPDSGLVLNLVYNPVGAFLPAGQVGLEINYKQVLRKKYGITFNHLFAITNLPISRFLDYLLSSNQYAAYMQKLVQSYNPAAVQNVMCRTMISVSWDGQLYDCDFNQMLELPVGSPVKHIRDFLADKLLERKIAVNRHCFGCTAGAGSSCGGEVVG